MEALWMDVQRFIDVPLHEFMGFDASKVTITEQGCAEIRIPITEKLLNASGAVHGGVYYFLVELGASVAFSSAHEDTFYVTSDINVSVLRPAFTGTLITRANLIKSGKRLAFVETKIYDEQDQMLAIGRVTKTILPVPESLAK
jgi:uncharacterized protein (TIGR00369 family)